MQIEKDNEVIKKAWAWFHELKKTAPDSDEIKLLRELIGVADRSVETSFGTLYPVRSENSNHPGIHICLKNKEHGHMTLGYIGENREEKEIIATYWAANYDKWTSSLVDEELLDYKKRREAIDDIPY